MHRFMLQLFDNVIVDRCTRLPLEGPVVGEQVVVVVLLSLNKSCATEN